MSGMITTIDKGRVCEPVIIEPPAPYFAPTMRSIDQLEWLHRVGLCMVGKFSAFRSFNALRGTAAGRDMIIVGGGPSLKQTLPRIRQRVAEGALVIALNKSDDWLRENGVSPDYAAMADCGDWVDYITPRHGTKYLLFTQLPEKTLDRFLPFNGQVYLCCDEEDFTAAGLTTLDVIGKLWPGSNGTPCKDVTIFGAGTTLGLNAIQMAREMGAASCELHGFDSCCDSAGNRHAYDKPVNLGQTYTAKIKSGDEQIEVTVSHALERQASDFAELMAIVDAKYADGTWDMPIRVAGSGVIPWMVQRRQASATSPIFSYVEA